jgi:GNAT superfamily N-acetyltransferase
MVSLNVMGSAGGELLPRIYRRAMVLWCSHVSDEMAFGAAAVYANRQLAGVPEANCILGDLAAAEVPAVLEYFAQARTRPLAWYLPEAQVPAPELGALEPQSLELWRLVAAASRLPQTHPELTVIPARASFRHVQQIAALMHPALPPEQAAEAALCHLDDPHVDALLALHQGQPAGYAAVLSTGEGGVVTDLFVAEGLRGRGYGKVLAAGVIDICQRSLFKHVLCALPSGEDAALAFAGRLGFAPAGAVLMRGQRG